jgi:large subunit ribosomal protein L10Ae
MSKISAEILNDAIEDLLKHALKTKKRGFTETIELQIGLKNYDPSKDKRFSGNLKLPFAPKLKSSICVIGNVKHLEEAANSGLKVMSEADLKLIKKDKKIVKKLAQSHSAFVASASLIRKIPRLLGPGLNKAGKFPTACGNADSVLEKVNEVKATIKFQLKNKKTLCIHVPVANVSMDEGEIFANTTLAINYFVSLLPKNWQQIKRVYLHSTMGPSNCIYGF